MAQHDYTIANQTFPNTRTDLNNVFAAIVSQNSGATAPSTTYAYQLWYDTTTDILKMRNANDDAWIELFTIDQVADTASPAGAVTPNPSLIINGAMQVAQRGTSFSSISSAAYPVDRFFVQDVDGSAGEATVSQSTTTPDDFAYSLKVDVTTADAALVADDQYKIEHRIEGQNISHLNWGTSAAKTVTLSFWIRSNKTGNTQVAVLNSANDRAYVANFSISAADTWERKELTIDGDASGTWLTTNGIGLRLRWGSYGSTYQTSSVDQWVGSQVMSRDDSPINFFDSADNELYLTGVQLEIGDTATPFVHRSYGEELALCQRYYEKIFYNHVGQFMNTSNTQIGVNFSVSKRASPTVSSSGTIGYSNGSSNYTNATFNTSYYATANNVDVRLNVPSGGFSAQSAVLVHNNSSSGFLKIDAEL